MAERHSYHVRNMPMEGRYLYYVEMLEMAGRRSCTLWGCYRDGKTLISDMHGHWAPNPPSLMPINIWTVYSKSVWRYIWSGMCIHENELLQNTQEKLLRKLYHWSTPWVSMHEVLGKTTLVFLNISCTAFIPRAIYLPQRCCCCSSTLADQSVYICILALPTVSKETALLSTAKSPRSSCCVPH